MAYEGDTKNYAPAEVDEVGAIILKARELLSDPAKWFKGAYVCTETGAMCILGAMGFDGDEATADQEDAALRVATLIKPSSLLGDMFDVVDVIAAFNDAPERDHADVLALLDRAASQQEKR